MTDWDDAEDQRPKDRHFIRDAFGMICLLGVFLIFLVVMIPALGPLLLDVL